MKYSDPEKAWYHEMKRRPQGEGCLLSLLSVTFLILAVALMIAFTGCTTTRYVPVEHHTTDTLRITQHQRDSVWLHDSIHVTERGDTVLIHEWHTKYSERIVHDTLYRAKHDSIPVPYEVVKEVPAELSAVQKYLIVTGIISLIAFVIFIAVKIKKFLP